MRMSSKTFILLGFLVAIVLLVSTDVTARDFAEYNGKHKFIVDETKETVNVNNTEAVIPIGTGRFAPAVGKGAKKGKYRCCFCMRWPLTCNPCCGP